MKQPQISKVFTTTKNVDEDNAIHLTRDMLKKRTVKPTVCELDTAPNTK
jgi:hypothetical protein